MAVIAWTAPELALVAPPSYVTHAVRVLHARAEVHADADPRAEALAGQTVVAWLTLAVATVHGCLCTKRNIHRAPAWRNYVIHYDQQPITL